VPNGLEAAREVIASQIGRWIGVDIPVVELIPAHPTGPCCVSRAIAGTVLPYDQAMSAPFSPAPLITKATLALSTFAPTIVLDALLGNCDRRNTGNIVFAESLNRWYTLDYSLSFNLYRPDGVGSAALPFGDPSLRQSYFPEILSGLTLNSVPFRTTVTSAEGIMDNDLDQLFGLLPTSHAANADVGAMLAFVKARRTGIRGILRTWCDSVGLNGIL